LATIPLSFGIGIVASLLTGTGAEATGHDAHQRRMHLGAPT